MTTTMPVLHGILCRRPPKSSRPCSLYKVACVHVAMKVGCVCVLFYPNWQSNKKTYYASDPLEKTDGSPSL